MAAALESVGLEQALFNVPSGDWAGGERGIACLPDRVEDFRAGVATALDYANALRCRKLNVIAGLVKPGADPQVLEDVLVDNLRYAAPRVADAGIKLLIEPINTRDIPGFFLTTTKQAERILERVGHDNLYIQYDFYHMQVMQGDLVPTYERLKDRIAHVQVAVVEASAQHAHEHLAAPDIRNRHIVNADNFASAVGALEAVQTGSFHRTVHG